MHSMFLPDHPADLWGTLPSLDEMVGPCQTGCSYETTMQLGPEFKRTGRDLTTDRLCRAARKQAEDNLIQAQPQLAVYQNPAAAQGLTTALEPGKTWRHTWALG